MSELSPAASRSQFRVALCAALLLCGAFAFALSSSWSEQARQTVSAAGLVLGGLGIVVSGTLVGRRCRGRRRRTWKLLTAAAGIALVGNGWVAVTGVDSAKDPSILGEGSIVIAQLLAIVGMIGMHTVRHRGAELFLMAMDGLVVGCAALVMTSILVYSQILESTQGSLPARLSSLAMALLDVALATVAALLIVRSHGDRLFFNLVGAGFLLYALSDLVFAVEGARGQFEFGTPVDLGWIAGYLLLTAAAWHPDAVGAEDDRPASVSDVRGTVLVFLLLLLALAVQMLHPDGELTRTQVVLWILLVIAAGARQMVLTADNAALRAGLEQRVREQTADLRRMARQTETLLSSVGDGIYGVDRDGRITFLNPSGARALGHPIELLLGRRAHQEFHAPREDGTPYPWSCCYVTDAIEKGLLSAAEEDTYVRADGSTFPVEITASPLLDDDRIVGAVVVFRDVTQRHEVDRMKNEFLSVVSHELRTPLTSIRGSLGLLASGTVLELGPQAARLVSIAVESSDRLTRLINDILDIERIENGRLPMSLAPHDAAALLRATATQMSGLAAASGVSLEVTAPQGRVLADADRIVQTLTNLVGNALKFSDRGAEVRLAAVAEADRVVFSVSDTGRGIPQDKLQSVFEPFEQVDSSDAREKGGTGLGLAISRGIVEQHGGRIWAESTPGTGTTVWFWIPRARERQGEVPDSGTEGAGRADTGPDDLGEDRHQPVPGEMIGGDREGATSVST